MNNFIQNYEIILTNISKFEINFDFTQIRTPKLSNIELIAMKYNGLAKCEFLAMNFNRSRSSVILAS